MLYTVHKSKKSGTSFTYTNIEVARREMQKLVDKGFKNAYIQYDHEAIEQFTPQVEMYNTTIIKPASGSPLSDVLNHLRLDELMDKQTMGEPMSIDEIRELDMLAEYLYAN